MNLAKISTNGQITLPVEIRKRLGVRNGDKVLFIEKPNGEIVVSNASTMAIARAQIAFQGAAEALGVKDEKDIQAMIDELRHGKQS